MKNVNVWVMICSLAIASLVYARTLPKNVPLPEVHKIGDYYYRFSYTEDTLGEVDYPYDDSLGRRDIILPKDKLQQVVSRSHEIIHACFHNHPHTFASHEEMEAHMKEAVVSDEESIVTQISNCLAESDIR